VRIPLDEMGNGRGAGLRQSAVMADAGGLTG
jgi:hypothetical protein